MAFPDRQVWVPERKVNFLLVKSPFFAWVGSRTLFTQTAVFFQFVLPLPKAMVTFNPMNYLSWLPIPSLTFPIFSQYVPNIFPYPINFPCYPHTCHLFFSMWLQHPIASMDMARRVEEQTALRSTAAPAVEVQWFLVPRCFGETEQRCQVTEQMWK